MPLNKCVEVKHKQFVEFGYDSLTLDEVRSELEVVVSGLKDKQFGKDYTIIGKMLEKDNPVKIEGKN